MSTEPEALEPGAEVVGERGESGQGGAGGRVEEAEVGGVKELAGDFLEVGGAGCEVLSVAQDGGAGAVEVDADLVGAAGFDRPLHEAYAVVGAQYPVVRNRRAPFYGLVNRSLARLGRTMHHGQIHLAHFIVRLKEPAEAEIRCLRFGKHHYAGGILIEPVHDARAVRRTNRLRLGAVLHKPPGKSLLPFVAGGRVHQEPGRFIDGQELVILEKHFDFHLTAGLR